MNCIQRYRKHYADVDGFLIKEAEIVWDFFLTGQKTADINGHMLEIGVFKGKSAFLASQYLRPDENIVLVDIHPLSAVVNRLREDGKSVEAHQIKSSNLALVDLSRYYGRVRWLHIDGDHSGFSTANDLTLAERFIADSGIIVVDDFMNPRYPQLAAEVYRFLFARPQYKMLMCGLNKCYIVRSENFAFWDGMTRKYLFEHAARSISLSRTSYAHDMGCWTVENGAGPHHVHGRDDDPTDIPF